MSELDRSKSYMEYLRQGSKGYKGIYKCQICLNKVEYDKYRVNNGDIKTCGCITGKHTMEYTVNKDGTITSAGGYNLSAKKANGYLSFKNEYLHRIIAGKFIPNPNNYKDVNHINGNKKDNRVENLEWCSRSQNIKHAWDNKLNTGVTGLRNSKRALNDNDVRYVRTCDIGCTTLSRKYGISKTAILNIRKFKTYKDVMEN